MHHTPCLSATLVFCGLVACGGAEPVPAGPAEVPADPVAGAATSQAAAHQEGPVATPADGPPAPAEAPPAATGPPSAPPDPPLAATDAPEAPPPATRQLPGANVNMGEVSVDGVTVKGLSCRTGGGGLGALLGTLTLTAGISKRRAQLDRCAAGGSVETPIHWHQGGGKISKVSASSPDGARNRCVEQALTGALATQDAECMATVVHGK